MASERRTERGMAARERRGVSSPPDSFGNSALANQVRSVLSRSSTPPTTMNAESLSTPVPRYNINTPPTTPTTNNLSQTNNQFGSKITTAAEPPVQTEREQVRSGFADYLKRLTGTAEETNKIKEDAGLEEKRKAASTLASEIQTYDKDFRDKVKRIRENTMGKTTQGVEGEIAQEQDRYESTRANKYLSYSIANQDYQAAEQIVNDKVQALKDQNSQLLQAYQVQNQMLNNDLSDSEKMKLANDYDTMQKDKDLLTDAYKAVLSQAGQNKAPPAVLSAIDEAAKRPGATAGDIYTAAGEYAVNRYEAAQLRKLNSDIASLDAETAAISGGITNPNAAQYSSLIQTVLGSTNFTKENKKSFITAVNNGEDPFTVIKNQARNILGTEGKDVIKLESALNAMNDLDTQLKEFYARGGDSGIFKGNFEKVLNKLGTVNDPRLVEIAVNIGTSLQKYRNAISGTAYSEQEGRDIASIFPGITKGEVLNNTIIRARKSNMESDIDSAYRSVLGNSYDTIKNLNRLQGQTQPVNDLSDDDAYNLYLQTIGGQSGSQSPTNTTPPKKRGYAPFEGLASGYKPFSFFR